MQMAWNISAALTSVEYPFALIRGKYPVNKVTSKNSMRLSMVLI